MKKALSILLLSAFLSTSFLIGGSMSGNAAAKTAASVYTAVVPLVYVGAEPKDISKIEAEIDKISVPAIGVKIKILPLSVANSKEKTNLMLSSGQQLDMLLLATFMGDNPSQMASQGKILAIDKYLAKSGQGLLKSQKDNLKAAKINGKTYGVPWFEFKGTPANAIYMRKDMVTKYNITVKPVSTWADIEKMYATIKKNAPEIIPFSGNGKAMFNTIYDSFGYGAFDLNFPAGALITPTKSTNIVNFYASNEYKDIVARMRKWSLAGYIAKDAATTNEDFNELVKAGRAFSILGQDNPGYIATISNQWGTPAVMTKLAGMSPEMNSGYAPQSWSIPVTSKNPEKAVALLNLMYTNKTVNNLMNNGIEGMHYVKTKDKDIINWPAGVNFGNTGYYVIIKRFGDPSQTYRWSPDKSSVYYDLAVYSNNAAKRVSKAYGYLFNADDYTSEMASVSNVISQYRKPLETGSVDPDKVLPEFLKKLEDAGIKDLINANKTQFASWLSKNK